MSKKRKRILKQQAKLYAKCSIKYRPYTDNLKYWPQALVLTILLDSWCKQKKEKGE